MRSNPFRISDRSESWSLSSSVACEGGVRCWLRVSKRREGREWRCEWAHRPEPIAVQRIHNHGREEDEWVDEWRWCDRNDGSLLEWKLCLCWRDWTTSSQMKMNWWIEMRFERLTVWWTMVLSEWMRMFEIEGESESEMRLDGIGWGEWSEIEKSWWLKWSTVTSFESIISVK